MIWFEANFILYIHHELSLKLLDQFMNLHSLWKTVCWIEQICCYCDYSTNTFQVTVQSPSSNVFNSFPTTNLFSPESKQVLLPVYSSKGSTSVVVSVISCWSVRLQPKLLTPPLDTVMQAVSTLYILIRTLSFSLLSPCL